MAGLYEYTQERKGFWREPDGTPTSESVAVETWVRVAYDELVDVAEEYHGVVRAPVLAERLQEAGGIRTTRSQDRWLPKVLGLVAAYCEHEALPPLTDLVVPDHDDLDQARRRLECYRWAGSAPDDVGEPRLLASATPARPARRAAPRRTGGSGSTSRAAAASSSPPRAPRVAQSDRPVAVCPTCFMALPATGICDTCD